ncbi:MAG: bifunctional oligoribonuclease/PAP phosphatase NrnA, partial [Deltaproteobacteria bacterium]|nr:bifunctional oligoribonuclease/PAP phosphatase NrnA [Deltaproteobacteria bacterium]
MLPKLTSTERVGTLGEVAAHLRGAKRVLVTAHPHPDGDAAGSVSAAMLALIHLGKEVVGYNPDPIPDRLRFLPCMDDVVQVLPEEGFDTTLLLDCSDDRMFLGSPPPRTWLGTVIALDHHKTTSSFADLVVRDPTAAAAGVVLYRLLEKLPVPLSVPIAEALYCALISDTGSFRYQNTNPEAMKMGAALLDAGVDPWWVSSNLYETQPRGQIVLLGEVLRTLRTSDDGWVAVLTVTQEMLAQAGCDESHVDGFINFARGLRGVEVAVLLRVSEDHVRVGLRSRGNVDVSTIAESFGGGGHP